MWGGSPPLTGALDGSQREPAPGISLKKSITSVPVSSRPEDRIHRIVIRDILRYRLVQLVDCGKPEDPSLARIVGAGAAGDDPVVGDIRALCGGVEVVRDQPGLLLTLHRRGAVLVEVRPVGFQVVHNYEVLLSRVDPAGVLHHGVRASVSSVASSGLVWMTMQTASNVPPRAANGAMNGCRWNGLVPSGSG